jgi:hypothetical protein
MFCIRTNTLAHCLHVHIIVEDNRNKVSITALLLTHMGTKQQKIIDATKQTATHVFYVPPYKLC